MKTELKFFSYLVSLFSIFHILADVMENTNGRVSNYVYTCWHLRTDVFQQMNGYHCF